ncbi:ribosomal RNA small subunit methyltransferase C [Enterobacter cloacae]|uniref:Ribosomal RNA small subunit methyltransferase C n=1 Tax=Enterobacter cloacae TaxID=550 RepID=A0A377M821_ENTCL|nr:ribosomal RNA small subunit methyltransferase C [Enterobacter cloacae]
MGERARFSLVAEQSDVADCDTLIYYWPKNKPEAQFQLMNLLSLLPVGCDIFVVGENRSGVRSAEQMLEAYAPLNKGRQRPSLRPVSWSSGKPAFL